MVGLLDLHPCAQSDVTSAERKVVFGDLRLSRFLQSGEEKSQCGWCVVSSFASLSFSELDFLVCWCRLPSFDLALLSRNLFFMSFFFSDRIKLGFDCFLLRRSRIGRKITFNYSYFFDNFHRHFAMCWSYAQKPPFLFWRKSQHP